MVGNKSNKFKHYATKPVTILRNGGFVSFDYSTAPLEVFIRYVLRPEPFTASKVVEKQCRHGHNWERLGWRLKADKNCLVCKKIHRIKEIDSGQSRERAKKRYEKHKEVHNATSMRRYWRDRENIIARQKAAKKRRKIELGQFCLGRLCPQCNVEHESTGQSLRYSGSNDCVICAKRRRRERRRLLTQTHQYSFQPEDWKGFLAAFGNTCAYCGCNLDLSASYGYAIDHFIPLSRGGSDVIGNYVMSCKTCNTSKYNRDPKEWYFAYKHFSPSRWKRLLKLLGKKEETLHQIPLI